MKIKKIVFLITIFFAFQFSAKAAFIDIAQPEPYNCPSACGGSALIFRVNNIQNLPTGALVQAMLSNASGSFASGTTLINSNRYSGVSGTGPWTNGIYTFSSNVSNLYFEIIIPVAQPAGTSYNINKGSFCRELKNKKYRNKKYNFFHFHDEIEIILRK